MDKELTNFNSAVRQLQNDVKRFERRVRLCPPLHCLQTAGQLL